jgi:ubiquinone/menaquinone biosynthesis C-methylase UbiE
MGIYSKFIFPRLMDLGMSSKVTTPYRQEVLQQARGEVLEIGFGSGLNLPYYPAHIQKLHTVEVNEGMNKLAGKNMARSSIAVAYHVLDAQKLPFPDDSFDTVVSSWTLCSIARVEEALAEVYRVLKPQGRFLFVEHGLSPDADVQKWQHRLTPLQKFMADGCHLDRNIESIIGEAGFRIGQMRKEYAAGTPKVSGYFYIGMATKQVGTPEGC